MADVRHEQIIAGAVGGGQRRGHALQRRIRRRVGVDRGVGLRVKPFRAFEDLIGGDRIDAQVPLAVMHHQVRHGAERDAAGHRAGAAFAETVGDQHHVAVLLELRRDIAARQAGGERLLLAPEPDHEEMIFIALAQRRPGASARRL